MTKLAALIREGRAADTDPSSPEKPSYRSKLAVKIRQRDKDFKRWARFRFGQGVLPWTDETKKFATIILHHYAPFAESYDLAGNFLTTWFSTAIMKPAERAAFVDRAFREARRYGAEELAVLIGLTAPVRYHLGITTIGCIDFPADARARFQALKTNAWKRQKRRGTPPRNRPAQRTHRRLNAVLDALPNDGSACSIRDIAARLLGSAAFARVSAGSLTRVLRRLIKADAGDRLISVAPGENKAFTGSLIRRRVGAPQPPSSARRTAPPPNPRRSLPLPTDALEFERWFFAELAKFTQETAGDMKPWFYHPDAQALRRDCGVAELDADFARIARTRRDELRAAADQIPGRRLAQ